MQLKKEKSGVSQEILRRNTEDEGESPTPSIRNPVSNAMPLVG